MTDHVYALSINGKIVGSERTANALNPATEAVICTFPLASRQHLEDAVAGAKNAFPAWSAAPVQERQARVRELGELIEQQSDRFIKLLVTEQGKSRAAAEWEISGAIHWLREIAKQALPEEVSERAEGTVVTRHTALGVIGAITPWNFPLLLAIWKVAPALVAGNTVVLKPSPYTPLCTLLFGELAQAVLAPGVLNILSGDNELGEWMTQHQDIAKISFTGSTATGRRVMQSASVNLKRLTLELGGNDPAIVLPDVDPKAVAKDLFWAAFANSGQFCVACKRLYIHESIYDELAAELVAYAKTVKLGSGLEAGVELGPLQNKMQFDKVCQLLEETRKEGFAFLAGGQPLPGTGYFIPVTFVDNPADDSKSVVEEAFGPVLPLLKYRDIEDVIRRANDTCYGLAASVWGKDIELAQSIARRLEVGTVWINQIHTFSPDVPFGGHKQSGLGIENSLHGLAEYTNLQTTFFKAMP